MPKCRTLSLCPKFRLDHPSNAPRDRSYHSRCNAPQLAEGLLSVKLTPTKPLRLS